MYLNLGEDKAKEVLLDVGYYRMGFYWHPLEKDKDHNFKAGTKFSDALDLYYLDSDLRHVFIKFLNRIEVNFKTKLIYEASNHYQTKPTWFADPSIMKKEFISQLPKYYDERFKNNNTALNPESSQEIHQSNLRPCVESLRVYAIWLHPYHLQVFKPEIVIRKSITSINHFKTDT